MEILKTPEEIAREYMQINLAINDLFRAAELRSGIGQWKKDGVGSCIGLTRTGSECGLIGPAKEVILRLRDKVNFKDHGHSRLTECPFHREDSGCSIPALKAPICASIVDDPLIWKKAFGIEGIQLGIDLDWVLFITLTQDKAKLKQYQPKNTPDLRDFNQWALNFVNGKKGLIERFPLLYPPAA